MVGQQSITVCHSLSNNRFFECSVEARPGKYISEIIRKDQVTLVKELTQELKKDAENLVEDFRHALSRTIAHPLEGPVVQQSMASNDCAFAAITSFLLQSDKTTSSNLYAKVFGITGKGGPLWRFLVFCDLVAGGVGHQVLAELPKDCWKDLSQNLQ
jgi:hypothetical protein